MSRKPLATVILVDVGAGAIVLGEGSTATVGAPTNRGWVASAPSGFDTAQPAAPASALD